MLWLIHLLDVCSEYYFSAQNLEKDRYLRSIMDIDGYVVLNEIAKFRRISGMHPTHEMVCLSPLFCFECWLLIMCSMDRLFVLWSHPLH